MTDRDIINWRTFMTVYLSTNRTNLYWLIKTYNNKDFYLRGYFKLNQNKKDLTYLKVLWYYNPVKPMDLSNNLENCRSETFSISSVLNYLNRYSEFVFVNIIPSTTINTSLQSCIPKSSQVITLSLRVYVKKEP